MELVFKGWPGHPERIYVCPSWSVRVGEKTPDLPEEMASRLMVDFPLMFEPVESPQRSVVRFDRAACVALLRGARLTEKQVGQLEKAGLINANLQGATDEQLRDAGMSAAAVRKVRKALAPREG